MPETQRIEQRDAYARAFDATVVACEDNAVAVDASCFYPGGGGQPPDAGVLRSGDTSWTVTKARSTDGVDWLEIDGAPPAVGTNVTGEIDWDRRHKLMRTHTALHILCGVVWRDYGAKVTGGNMEPLRGRMDFEFESLRAELVHEIEQRVNAEIAAGRAVRVGFLDRQEADAHPDLIRTKVNLLPPELRVVRVVEIEGLDLQADGGTHVANTREVGRIHVTGYESKGRINKRIRISLQDA